MLKKYSDKTIAEINKGKLPTAVVKKKIDFYKEGLKGDVTACNNSKVEDKRWGGSWMVSADLESRLVFSTVTPT